MSVEGDRWEALGDQAVANAVMSGPELANRYVTLQSLWQIYAAGEKRARDSSSDADVVNVAEVRADDQVTTAGTDTEAWSGVTREIREKTVLKDVL